MRIWRQHWGVWFAGAIICFGASLSDSDDAGAQSRGADSRPGSRNLKQPTIRDEGAGIVPARSLRDKREKLAPVMEDKPADKQVTINPFAKQTDELWRCRYQVAAASRRYPDKVLAGRMLIRFTVDTSGVPINATVVALEPTDPDVLVCVKQAISRWRLLPLPLQAIPIEVEVSLALPQVSDDVAKR